MHHLLVALRDALPSPSLRWIRQPNSCHRFRTTGEPNPERVVHMEQPSKLSRLENDVRLETRRVTGLHSLIQCNTKSLINLESRSPPSRKISNYFIKL